MSIESVMSLNHLILCCPLLLLPSIFPSIRVFSNELALPIKWPKYRSFRCSINPSNEYSGLIPFRIDWFDLLAVKSLQCWEALQFEGISSSALSLFFIVQLSRPCMTTRKTIALPIWTFVSKVRRRKQQLIPVFLPGESHGQRDSLVGYNLWGHRELDMIEVTEQIRMSDKGLIFKIYKEFLQCNKNKKKLD